MTNLLRLGSCPDSWGVWYADDPRQLPWQRFLDELARVGYVHIKQMDPAIVETAERRDLAFGQAVAMGASCEPPAGLPDIPSVVEALTGLDREMFVVVEQDMYPLNDFGAAEPIAARTRDYLRGVGIGA